MKRQSLPARRATEVNSNRQRNRFQSMTEENNLSPTRVTARNPGKVRNSPSESLFSYKGGGRGPRNTAWKGGITSRDSTSRLSSKSSDDPLTKANSQLPQGSSSIPVVTITRNGQEMEFTQELRKLGVFRDYLQALDKVRTELNQLQVQMQQQLDEFYQTSSLNAPLSERRTPDNARSKGTQASIQEEGSGTPRNHYLCKMNESFDICNRCLENAQRPSVTINNHEKVTHFIESLKELPLFNAKPPSADVLKEVQEFSHNLKYSLEVMQSISDKFETNIETKLKRTCLSFMIYSPGEISLSASLRNKRGVRASISVAHQYSQEVQNFLTDLDAQVKRIKILANASVTGIDSSLINSSSLSHQVVVECNVSEYPLLLVIPEVSIALENMFRTATNWLDREETYISEISQEIHRTRLRAGERQQEIVQKQRQHQELMRSVKTAYLACQNSKQRLHDLTVKLAHLEDELKTVDSRKSKAEYEKTRKEGMLDFLEISIAQTRRNHILQLKRQKILRQVKELENNLQTLQQHLHDVTTEVNDHLNLKTTLETQFSDYSNNYKTVRKDLNLLSMEMRSIQSELMEVRMDLNHLESVQTVKTSMETLETLNETQEVPSNVILSPSLQEKLNRKRKPRDKLSSNTLQ